MPTYLKLPKKGQESLPKVTTLNACAPARVTAFALFHAKIQLSLFTLVAALPAFLTSRMYFVDLAWPVGVSLIAMCSLYWLLYEEPEQELVDPKQHASAFPFSVWDRVPIRAKAISLGYFLHGARMSVGAAFMIASGGWSPSKPDLPRYKFARKRELFFGRPWNMLVMQKEIFTQCFANSAVLFLPCIMCVLDTTPILSPAEYLGFGTWMAGWAIEWVADVQKVYWSNLSQKARGGFCNIGLWKYSRHPNYFGEWVAWNGLMCCAIPSLLRLELSSELDRMGLAAILAFLSASMYYCLSEWTGAIPAEHFSARKRPGYVDYQASTSMIIPWSRYATGWPVKRS